MAPGNRRAPGGGSGAVSLPLFQFLLLRWYFRLFIWARFLWQVSRLGSEAAADASGSLRRHRLSGDGQQAFAPVLVAQGRCSRELRQPDLLRRRQAAGIQDGGRRIGGRDGVRRPRPAPGVRRPSPTPSVAGMREYGTLAQRYVREFDDKWLRGGAAADEPFVGSGDIQSLADLGNSFEVVKNMRLVPFTHADRAATGRHTLAPVVPLTLTMISLEELLGRCSRLSSDDRHRGGATHRDVAPLAAGALGLLLMPLGAPAQELEPGAYWPIPRTCHLHRGQQFQLGRPRVRPGLPVEDGNARINTTVVAFTRAFSLAGRSANAGLVLPVVGGHLEGVYLGFAVETSRSDSAIRGCGWR
jgi:hypothetical protein